MKLVKYIFLIFAISASLISCKKDASTIIPATSLNVVNASPGVLKAKIKTPNANGYFSGSSNQVTLTGVSYGKNAVFTIPAGSSPVMIAGADTTKLLYNSDITSMAGDIYSLFIAGPNGNDIFLNKDNIPYITDSSFGVRFINLSYNSDPINVALVTSAMTNEFSSIGYKAITDFKSYDASGSAPASYQFQVMGAVGNILATSSGLSKTTLLHHNVTLVLRGGIDSVGVNAPKITVVNNY